MLRLEQEQRARALNGPLGPRHHCTVRALWDQQRTLAACAAHSACSGVQRASGDGPSAFTAYLLGPATAALCAELAPRAEVPEDRLRDRLVLPKRTQN